MLSWRLADLAGPAGNILARAAHRPLENHILKTERIAQPRMVDHSAGIGPVLWLQCQHGQQEIGNVNCVAHGKLVLFHQHIFQAPRLQFGDAVEIAVGIKKVSRIVALLQHGAWERANQLDDLRHVVVVLGVRLPASRIEQVVACQQLKHKARKRPQVCAGAPMVAQQHFGRPVLACLDLVREVVVHPAGIAQVCDFDRDQLVFIHHATWRLLRDKPATA